MKADLHIHSTFSDGSTDLADIINIATSIGLDAIAITDHDTVEHFDKIPIIKKLRVFAGIEISAAHRKTKVKAHILGYGISKPEIVAALTLPLLEARNRNSKMQIDILTSHGYKFDKNIPATAGGKYIYKQHIMDWLVKTSQTKEIYGDFYYKTFKNGGICDFKIDYIDACDAVIAIKESGGLAVLAHPGQQQNYDQIPELVELGLDGLELNHRSNSKADMAIIRDCAKRYSLFLTGGSDFHGRYASSPVGIGEFLSDISGINALYGA